MRFLWAQHFSFHWFGTITVLQADGDSTVIRNTVMVFVIYQKPYQVLLIQADGGEERRKKKVVLLGNVHYKATALLVSVIRSGIQMKDDRFQ